MRISILRRYRSVLFGARAISLIAVASAVVAVSVVSPPPADAVTVGQLKTPAGLCLDNKGGVTSQNNPVLIWTCNGGPQQTWTGADNGSIQVQGQCLTPYGGIVRAYVPVVIARCNGGPAQTWTLRSNGTFSIRNSTLCLDNPNNSTRPGNAVQLYACNASDAQRWLVVVSGFPAPTTPPPVTTPPVTTPPPPPASSNPSGVSAPKGDLPGWQQIFVDDFSKPSATGSWANDCDPAKIVYTGAEGQKWRTYPKCYKDTYQKRPYRADAVLSTHDSVADYWLRQVDGIPAGASISPVINSAGQNQTYGRYTARFKVDTPNLREYYVAWLLWPQSEKWPVDGEMDFPEGSLAGSPGGFHHYSGAGSCVGGCQDQASATSAKFTEWHTYTMEWSPGRVRYILDDTVVLDSTKWVPSTPMRWELQTETNGNGSSSGHLLLDWVSVYRWVG
nr:ricin-type beta-trefoil lectin domain protein [uncultured Rhodococcus sp.]